MKPLGHLMLLMFTTSLFAQGLGKESHFLNRLPWNGDWMESAKDQMVHGEDYLGYPGPLVKMYAALGLDPNDPGVRYELMVLVQRDSPFWYGTCNGWAASAIQYDEPLPMVVNGVKLFSGEAKALLSANWKHSIERTLGEYADGTLTPDSMENLLYTYIANDQEIIFDIVSGRESWNYPVGGFTRETTDAGDWVNVDIELSYVGTSSLRVLEYRIGDVQFLRRNYQYRYSKSEPRVYEWISEVRPHRAWVPTTTIFTGDWYSTANNYNTTKTFENLLELSSRPDALSDLFEPNDELGQAYKLRENLTLGSLTQLDSDFYQIDVAAGEVLDIAFSVYDGPALDLQILDAQGEIVAEHLAVTDVPLQLSSPSGASYFVAVSHAEGQDPLTPSFYRMLSDEKRAWIDHPETPRYQLDAMRVINVLESEQSVSSTSITKNIAPLGSAELDPGPHRNTSESVWALEGRLDGQPWRSYVRDYPHRMDYIIPHLTFGNGWTTSLRVFPENTQADVTMKVYDSSGSPVQTLDLSSSVLSGEVSLWDSLSINSITRGAWFELLTDSDNRLFGKVIYSHKGGPRAEYDVRGESRIADLRVFDLKSWEDGWTGLSMVNVSEVENEILFRHLDGQGNILVEDKIVLQPGERWLGAPSALSGVDTETDHSLHLYSRVRLATLVLQRDYDQDRTYAHRMHDEILDGVQNTWFTVSKKYNQEIVVANLHSRTNWVSLQAFAEDGEELGTVFLTGRSIRAWRVAHINMEDVLADDRLADVTKPIAYFRLFAQRPVYAFELTGNEKAEHHVQTVNFIENP